MQPCLDDNAALELIEGRLSSAARAGVESHLAGCTACREVLAELAKLERGDIALSPTELSAPLPSRQLAPGDQAGPYRVERVLGQGGSGVVYRATDERTGRIVALKVVVDPALRARFAREASVLARLDHEAIVRYVDHGSLPSGMFLAMEWLEGEDLQARLARGPIGWQEARVLGLRLTAALAQAHALGCVHRDVSPRNVFLPGGRIDQAKLLDFGLVRIQGSELAQTSSQAVLGTPFYMAPEQVRDPKRVDGRADLFGLGALLFEAISGVRPFQADDLFTVWIKIVDTPAPDLRRCTRELVPEPLVRLVDALLAKDPNARPPSAGEVHRLLTTLTSLPSAGGGSSSASPLAMTVSAPLGPSVPPVFGPSLPPPPAPAFSAPPAAKPQKSGLYLVLLGSVLFVLAGLVLAGVYALIFRDARPRAEVASAPPAKETSSPSAKEAAPAPASSSAPPAFDDTATGPPKHYWCGGDQVDVRKHGRYAPEPAFAEIGFAVQAGGSCKLTLEDCDIAGPHSVELLGDSVITLKRCKVHGQIKVMGPTTLVLEKTTIHEPPVLIGQGGKIVRR